MTAQEALAIDYSQNQMPDNFKEESRTQRLKRAYLAAKPTICMERALAFTRSHKETEGEALTIRRAKAFRKACETISVKIFDARTQIS